MCRRARVALVLVIVGSLASARGEEEARVVEARREFVTGLDLIKRAQWAEALGAFERSLKLRRHAITVYNLGACERALGRYTRARALFERALALNQATPGELPDSLVLEARGFFDEIDRVLARVHVTIDPASAQLAVDGRPLEAAAGEPATLVAGTLDPGPAAAAPAAEFDLLIDPGTHVFTLARQGFADILLRETFAPGARRPLPLHLEQLPATLRVASNRTGAVVAVDDIDVGATPAMISRPAGSYRVVVRKRGFVTYQTAVTVRAGEEADLRATLQEVKPTVLRRWWFWTIASAVIAGGALGAYFIARSAETPTPDGGGLQWVVQLR